MTKYGRFAVRALVVAALTVACSAAWAGEIVIVNASVGASSVNRATLELIFLGSAKNYGDGVPVVVATLKEGAVHESFLKSFLSKTPPQFQRAWRDLVFGGGASRLPQSFATEAELVEYVAKTKGAIGYIDDSTPHPGVKVLKITD